MHVRRRDSGSGMYQWFNDEYWIWQWDDWQQLDVTSWYADAGSYLPAGLSLGGVAEDYFDLANLQNISPVRRTEDAQCCPSGGVARISFEWVDFTLVIREFVRDPEADFRAL